MTEEQTSGQEAGKRRVAVISPLCGLSKEEKRRRLEEACSSGDSDVLRFLRVLLRRLEDSGEAQSVSMTKR